MGSGHVAGTHHQGNIPQTPQMNLPPPGAANRNCFIATAVYGSPDDEHVLILREFRDKWLLTNGPGRRFVALYYQHGPRAAQIIAEHEALKRATRFLLLPIVGFGYLLNQF